MHATPSRYMSRPARRYRGLLMPAISGSTDAGDIVASAICLGDVDLIRRVDVRRQHGQDALVEPRPEIQ